MSFIVVKDIFKDYDTAHAFRNSLDYLQLAFIFYIPAYEDFKEISVKTAFLA